MAIPFSASNVLALDGAVAGSVTESVDGVTQWADQGPGGNDFFNDHAAGSQPGYSSPALTFDGGDHLHRDPDAGPTGLIPATGDWACVARGVVSSTVDETFVAQYEPSAGNGRIIVLRVSAGALSMDLGNDATQPSVQITGGTVVTGTTYTMTARRSGNTFDVRLDGTQVGSNTDAGTRSLLQTGNVLGARSTSGSDYDAGFGVFLNGSVRRVGLWTGTFSDAELEAMEEWAETGDFTPISTFSQRARRFSP